MVADQIKSAFPEVSSILPLVAVGGQKEVYKAFWGTQAVALKLIKITSNAQERTEREIAAVQTVNSNYVAKIFNSGKRMVAGENRHFIIEQYIEGQNYREFLKNSPIQSLNNVLNLGHALISAIVDFEAVGLVHRDIKPENLMIGLNGKVWIIDFGIVRFLNLESLTQTGQHFGPCTLGYGAPEQLRNIKAQINSRADLFSAGIVIYETINRFNPYLHNARDALDIVRKMESLDLPPLKIQGDKSGALSEFIQALTSRFPSRRPQTAKEAFDWFMPIYKQLYR